MSVDFSRDSDVNATGISVVEFGSIDKILVSAVRCSLVVDTTESIDKIGG